MIKILTKKLNISEERLNEIENRIFSEDRPQNGYRGPALNSDNFIVKNPSKADIVESLKKIEKMKEELQNESRKFEKTRKRFTIYKLG